MHKPDKNFSAQFVNVSFASYPFIEDGGGEDAEYVLVKLKMRQSYACGTSPAFGVDLIIDELVETQK